MDRHLDGEVRKLAVLIDGRTSNEKLAEPSSSKRKKPSQPDIRKSVDSFAKGVYLEMMKTAWEMALTPSMPHKHFSVLVKCQRINGMVPLNGTLIIIASLFSFLKIFLALFISFVSLIQ